MIKRFQASEEVAQGESHRVAVGGGDGAGGPQAQASTGRVARRSAGLGGSSALGETRRFARHDQILAGLDTEDRRVAPGRSARRLR